MKKICGNIFWVLVCLSILGMIIYHSIMSNWPGALVCGLVLVADICCAVDYFKQVKNYNKETKKLKYNMRKFEGSNEIEPNINDFII